MVITGCVLTCVDRLYYYNVTVVVWTESTRPGDGFKGCLFRAQFDNLYPLREFSRIRDLTTCTWSQKVRK